MEQITKSKTKTVNDLVWISTKKSKRISSGLMRLGSKPSMIVPFPLRHVVLQNTTATLINDLLKDETDGTRPITYYDTEK
jgi:hypothetical protein